MAFLKEKHKLDAHYECVCEKDKMKKFRFVRENTLVLKCCMCWLQSGSNLESSQTKKIQTFTSHSARAIAIPTIFAYLV